MDVTATTTSAAEDIFVMRTHRTSRIEGATPACAAAPFTTRQQDYYELYSVRTDEATGMVTDAQASPVRGFTACLGEFRENGTFDMFMVGQMAQGDAYQATAECEIVAGGAPVEGSFLLHCHGLMTDPPSGYGGGYVTSSTLAPTGAASDVPGYVSTSIVTMRLWRDGA
jgi:hypothetical protein